MQRKNKAGEVGLKPPAITSYAEAIDRFPSKSTLAAAIRVPGSTVRSWHARDAIPAHYFALVGEAAKQLKVPVTTRALWALFNARNELRLAGKDANSVSDY